MRLGIEALMYKREQSGGNSLPMSVVVLILTMGTILLTKNQKVGRGEKKIPLWNGKIRFKM